MTTPVYNPQVPLPEDPIANAQPAFLTNFSQIFSAFNSNHVSLNDPTNPGNHSVIQLLEQSQDITTQAQEIAIYSKKVSGQTDQLFMRYRSNGKEFQLSQYQIYPITQTEGHKAFFTFLPGGIIVYFGRIVAFGNTTVNINLEPAICRNIMGINLGGIVTRAPQPNVSLISNLNKKFSTVVLKTLDPMPDQYYLIFGNI